MAASIEQIPGTCGGKPRIAGTRIKVSLIAILSERNRMTPDEIVEAYPHLSLAQVHAASPIIGSIVTRSNRQLRDDDKLIAGLQQEQDASVASPS